MRSSTMDHTRRLAKSSADVICARMLMYLGLVAIWAMLGRSGVALAQGGSWTIETIDNETLWYSLVYDPDGNATVAYDDPASATKIVYW